MTVSITSCERLDKVIHPFQKDASDPDAPVSGDEIIDVDKEVDGFEGQESFSGKREGGDRSMASEKEAQDLALYRRESW